MNKMEINGVEYPVTDNWISGIHLWGWKTSLNDGVIAGQDADLDIMIAKGGVLMPHVIYENEVITNDLNALFSTRENAVDFLLRFVSNRRGLLKELAEGINSLVSSVEE